MKILRILALVGALAVCGVANDVAVYIIHDNGGTPKSLWYPWLKSELSREISSEIKAENIDIPELQNPAALQAWKDKIRASVGRLSERTYFVAHGLGGIAALKYIEESGHKIGGIVLVSGFEKPTANMDKKLAPFGEANLDFKKITGQIKHITVIAARDDKSVPYKTSEELSEKLGAKFVLEQGGRKAANKVGYTSPRIIYNEIYQMIDADTPKPAEENTKKK